MPWSFWKVVKRPALSVDQEGAQRGGRGRGIHGRAPFGADVLTFVEPGRGMVAPLEVEDPPP